MVARLFFFFFTLGLCAQELPPIKNYAPADYNGENQNWSITQTEGKLIYIANNKSLLEFNGSEWAKYPSPNGSIIRSVKAVGNKIYTGAYKEFGFWEKDGYGKLHYTSLSNKVDIEFLANEEFRGIRPVMVKKSSFPKQVGPVKGPIWKELIFL